MKGDDKVVKQYQITKLINNNVVFSVDDEQNEIIIFGKGIGFGKKRGDIIDNARIIKVFEACNAKEKNYLINLVEDIQPLYIDIAAKIITLFETKLNSKVNDMMNISLSDHISNAVANKKEGFELSLDILQEVKNIYPKEFMIAKEGLKLIQFETNVTLSEDEAGYIVLHYINSQGKSFRSDAKFRLLFQEKIIHEIESTLKVSLDRSSLYYTRFLTHLSFLAARIHDDELLHEGNSSVYQIFINQYPELRLCVEMSTKTIYEEFHVQINDEEKGYLAIHINNMIKSLKRKEQRDETNN